LARVLAGEPVATSPGHGRAENGMAELSVAERQVVDWIAAERDTVLGLIETLVNTDSGSLDKAGVDAVGAHIRAFLLQRGIASDTVPNARYGDGVRATVGGRSGAGNGTILLMGHRDTVYTQGEAARRPFRVAGGP
jgi:glutamate carboxypeptidase